MPSCQVFVTMGTSALEKFGRKPGETRSLDDIIGKLNDATFYTNRQTVVAKNMQANLEIFLSRGVFTSELFSAELASILAMKKEGLLSENPGHNEIVLLHSDTDSSRLCAAALKEVIDSVKTGPAQIVDNNKQVKVIPIQGLDDKKPNKFKEGLQNLKSIMDEYEIIAGKKYFNITGGYKALVTFTAVLAWDLEMTVCYLYEKSQELIKINKPLGWDHQFINIVDATIG